MKPGFRVATLGTLDLVISFAVAALGALLTLTGRLARTALNDARLKRRYPVEGTYLTTYSDNENGSTDVFFAETSLSQKGRSITGKTVLPESDRTWVLNGTVESGGFVHGTYQANDPHDAGIGTFFWNIDVETGDLTGIWSGFDTVDNSVDSGSYNLKKVVPHELRTITTESDIRAVIAIMGESLGERYIEYHELVALIDDPDSICLAALDPDGTILGAITASVGDQARIEELLPEGQEGVASKSGRFNYHNKVMLVRSVVIASQVRGRGLGAALISESLNWGSGRGATFAISFGWERGGRIPISRALSAMGFKEGGRIEGFWHEDSLAWNYECADCGIPCNCAGVVFRRPLKLRIP